MSLYLTARVLDGVAHGFTTRLGGTSKGPFESLNLGRRVGDEEAAIRDNHRRLAAAARFELAALVTPDEQVHGNRVVNADNGPVGKCDGLATRHRVVGIRVADCVPVLLWEPSTGAAAALHAGWRGVEAGIAARGVELLGESFRVEPERIRAAIGPAIGGCCYEVDDATAGKLAAAAPGIPRVPTRPGHVRVDLRAALREQLATAGVSQMEVVGGCTACERDLFFSHRRDGGRTGRHLAFIAGGKGTANGGGA